MPLICYLTFHHRSYWSQAMYVVSSMSSIQLNRSFKISSSQFYRTLVCTLQITTPLLLSCSMHFGPRPLQWRCHSVLSRGWTKHYLKLLLLYLKNHADWLLYVYNIDTLVFNRVQIFIVKLYQIFEYCLMC